MVKGTKSMGIINFINNFRYLFRYNLKNIYKNTEDFQYAIDHVKYEIEEDLKQIPRITIKSNEEALNKLLNSNCSLSRFGDGEMTLICETDIPSQKASKLLAEKLKKVLQDSNKELIIGIQPICESLMKSSESSKNFTRRIVSKYKPYFSRFLKENYDYYNVGFTMPYMYTGADGNRTEYLCNYYDKFRELWNNKDIIIVCGERVFKNIKYNIYDNAKSIEYIYGPTNNAFVDYDKILNSILEKDKNKLVILILGATATVLAHDLSKKGFRALDLGHLGKDYDAFRKKLTADSNAIKNFYKPE